MRAATQKTMVLSARFTERILIISSTIFTNPKAPDPTGLFSCEPEANAPRKSVEGAPECWYSDHQVWNPDMEDSARRTELKNFLKAKRAATSPESVGLPRGLRRLKPGLRREELATLAGVGLTWYTWLEQGRPINPSRDLLRRICLALRLDPPDEAYLFKLAGFRQPDPPASTFRIEPAMMRLLETYPAPAFIIDALFDIIVSNRLADRLYRRGAGRSAGEHRFADNQIWQIFMNPARRSLYVDFDQDVRRIVALFRSSTASQLGNSRFQDLISAVRDASPQFARMWDERDTATPEPITIRMSHPDFGELQVHSVRLPIEGGQGAMVVFVVPADDQTRRAFARQSPGRSRDRRQFEKHKKEPGRSRARGRTAGPSGRDQL